MTELKQKTPVVILLDIETSPIKGWAWEMYDTRVLKAIEPSKVISVAWKELHDPVTRCKSIFDYKTYKKGQVDDEQLIKDTWKVLDRADVAVAHYGSAFDFKKLAARFVYYGLTAPSSFKIIDTKKEASKHFKFDSNSLDNLGDYLGVGRKINNGGFDLWIRCIEDGDKDAWAKMKEYNVQDVDLLEKVYLKLRPYMTHPNLSAIAGNVGMVCPTCQSPDIQRRGFSITRTGRRQRFACQACGSWSSGAFERGLNILSPVDE